MTSVQSLLLGQVKSTELKSIYVQGSLKRCFEIPMLRESGRHRVRELQSFLLSCVRECYKEN